LELWNCSENYYYRIFILRLFSTKSEFEMISDNLKLEILGIIRNSIQNNQWPLTHNITYFIINRCPEYISEFPEIFVFLVKFIVGDSWKLHYLHFGSKEVNLMLLKCDLISNLLELLSLESPRNDVVTEILEYLKQIFEQHRMFVLSETNLRSDIKNLLLILRKILDENPTNILYEKAHELWIDVAWFHKKVQIKCD